ncbi:MAG: penicillin-binding protein activator [Gammaproteobacteria bacterium]|nr:penicillin-binding protein activator [Gammaproteobacteria bacterium]NIR82274.1 penicillin-binding protein activator [Gammaproteobacteria bacterium]NIR91205.1 penicillin-binding protein activator [Gammaproteobacteria bacterium]NIU03423.1 penicillin-binding protein activator [Gammaproteobacteria bacterium]NIX84698.1 ABC transporter substrate-binding protein [Gammaproteobacteria bacterium]
MTPDALAEARVPPPDTLGGWIQLAYIANQTLTDPSAFQQALSEWREQYPGHSGLREIVPELRELSLERAAPPEHVALLLPFQGRFAQAAEAVRDGFLAAWYADTDNPARPEITVRDASAANVRSVYERAVEAGADFVVGPLDKESVSTLAGSARITVPTLALNVVSAPAEETPAESETLADEETAPVGPASATDNPAREAAHGTELPDALYQFALSPEGEASRVAERAWFAGYERAGVIVPEGVWGERVADAFTAAWERLGGAVVGSETYPNDTPEMSASVERLLNVNESRGRWLALRRLLRRDIEYEPRVRQDIDFVFMAAFPRQARQLRPQLKFHNAEDIPVYATSHIFSGVEDASADRDIDGVIFGDMPWVLLAEATDELRQKIKSAWSDSFEDYVRLYAFGVDAYRVIPHLGKLRARRYAAFNGKTGRLSLDATNRIERQLMWAEFRDGIPRTGGSDMALR